MLPDRLQIMCVFQLKIGLILPSKTVHCIAIWCWILSKSHMSSRGNGKVNIFFYFWFNVFHGGCCCGDQLPVLQDISGLLALLPPVSKAAHNSCCFRPAEPSLGGESCTLQLIWLYNWKFSAQYYLSHWQWVKKNIVQLNHEKSDRYHLGLSCMMSVNFSGAVMNGHGSTNFLCRWRPCTPVD